MTQPPSWFPLSAAQRGIWLGQQLVPQSPVYWTAEATFLNGPLNFLLLERAVLQTVQEAESLRTRYRLKEGEPAQSIGPACHEVALVDFTGERDPHGAGIALMRRDLSTAPHIARGPVFRAVVLRLAATTHCLYLRAHHIAIDGYGFTLLQQRIAELYACLEQGRNPTNSLARPVRGIVQEDERYRQSPSFQRDAAWWRSQRAEMPEAASILPPCALSDEVRKAESDVTELSLTKLDATASRWESNTPTVLLALTAAWLGRLMSGKQHVIGVPLAGRFASVGAGTPCMMMNIIPLSVGIECDERLSAVAQRVGVKLAQARPYTRYRYEDMKRDLGLSRRGRLFDAVVNIMPFKKPATFGPLEATTQTLAAGPVEDIAIHFVPRSAGLRVVIEANANAYPQPLLDELLTSLVDCLRFVFDNEDSTVHQLPVASTVEQTLRGHGGGPASCSEPARGKAVDVLAGIQLNARLRPQAIALEDATGATTSYEQLLVRIQDHALALLALGVGPEDIVAVLLPRSADAIVAQLAVLWVGAAFLPLAPEGPRTRIEQVLSAAQPHVVITTRAHQQPAVGYRALLLEATPPRQLTEAAPSPVQVEPSTLAYVIFTSGTTGQPQGVMIERGALAHFVAAASDRYDMQASDRVLQFAPLQFDASVEEIYLTLTRGATLVLRSDEMIGTLRGFIQDVARRRITVLDLPTAFWHELTLELERTPLPECVRLTIIGGEAALAEPVKRFLQVTQGATRLENTYGPTEATVVCTSATLGANEFALRPGLAPPIGRPVPGVEVVVLDAKRRVVSVHQDGELCILGPTLARGYLGNPEKTQERFITLRGRWHGKRGYLTGDRVRMDTDGQLLYLGRIDDELKISGYRVTPSEVETALLTLTGVIEAAVVVAGVEPRRLVAFVVLDGANETTLRRALQPLLPAPAIPTDVRALDRLPRDSNGKLDRRALLSLAQKIAPASEAGEPPLANGTPTEMLIASVFRDVLGRASLNVDDDFFLSGGHSLSAIQAGQRLARVLGRDVALSELFRHPSARALAASLASTSNTASEYRGQDPLAPLVVLSVGGEPPLVCVHPAGGLAWGYVGLVRWLPEATLLGLQEPGLTGDPPESFPALVTQYLATLRSAQPKGPYRFLGWSSGGGIAHAMAVELEAAGAEVDFVAMLDAFPADIWHGTPEPTEIDALVSMLDDLDASPVKPNGKRYTVAELLAKLRAPASSLAAFSEEVVRRMARATHIGMRNYRAAKHGTVHCDVFYYRAAQRPSGAPDMSTWKPYCAGRFERFDVDATHLSMCQPASLQQISATLRARMGLVTPPAESDG